MAPDPTSAAAHSARPDAVGRRTRLRQYQVQLLERMQAARNDTGARVNQLGVMIGAERYLLDLTQAGEILPVTPIMPVPLTRPWYLGLANVRGNLVSIIDFARYCELSGTALGPDTRVVTFAQGLGFNCGLLVTRVYGLRYAGDMERTGERLRDRDGNDWSPLDLSALVREARFLQIGF
ncbi:MAG: chemotaxis protein CheW [Pseudomonadota bacterium]